MTEEEENMDYEEDYGNEDNIDIEADNIFEGKYEFLTINKFKINNIQIIMSIKEL